MKPISLAKDKALSREQLSEIAAELYGSGERWYSALARDLTDIRGTPTAISSAAVQQWMNADNRYPPWWATEHIYSLLSKRRSELMLRALRLEAWIQEIEKSHLKPERFRSS